VRQGESIEMRPKPGWAHSVHRLWTDELLTFQSRVRRAFQQAGAVDAERDGVQQLGSR